MNNLTNEQLDELHKHSFNNKEELEKSKICGCFYCYSFPIINAVNNWSISFTNDNTGICPYCNVDSIIGDICINIKNDGDKDKFYDEFFEILEKMHDRFFGKEK